jgi:uncharacterized protein with PQ loop repeat
MGLAQALGWIATILFTIQTIPQMIKTLQTKTVTGVSLSLFVFNLVANVIALIYALLIMQSPLIIKYILGIITTIVYLIIYLITLNK